MALEAVVGWTSSDVFPRPFVRGSSCISAGGHPTSVLRETPLGPRSTSMWPSGIAVWHVLGENTSFAPLVKRLQSWDPRSCIYTRVQCLLVSARHKPLPTWVTRDKTASRIGSVSAVLKPQHKAPRQRPNVPGFLVAQATRTVSSSQTDTPALACEPRTGQSRTRSVFLRHLASQASRPEARHDLLFPPKKKGGQEEGPGQGARGHRWRVPGNGVPGW